MPSTLVNPSSDHPRGATGGTPQRSCVVHYSRCVRCPWPLFSRRLTTMRALGSPQTASNGSAFRFYSHLGRFQSDLYDRECSEGPLPKPSQPLHQNRFCHWGQATDARTLWRVARGRSFWLPVGAETTRGKAASRRVRQRVCVLGLWLKKRSLIDPDCARSSAANIRLVRSLA